MYRQPTHLSLACVLFTVLACSGSHEPEPVDASDIPLDNFGRETGNADAEPLDDAVTSDVASDAIDDTTDAGVRDVDTDSVDSDASSDTRSDAADSSEDPDLDSGAADAGEDTDAEEDAGPDADTGDAADSDAADTPRCGDGAIDDGEECDDGNTAAGDGCSASCTVECEDGFERAAGSCIDIDECERELDACDPLVTCTNTEGGYTCGSCPLGYTDVDSDGTRCESLFASPPEEAPQCYLWGTHHMRSFDGLAYDIQGAGEWRMVTDPGDAGFEVQVRQEALAENDLASVITRVAVRDGERRVEVSADGQVVVDGTNAEIPEEGLGLATASVHGVADAWVVAWPSLAQVRITQSGAGLDVEVYPSEAQEGRLRGLCADAAGTPVDDVLPPSGTPLLPPVAIEELYASFLHAWQVSVETSLFTYADGEGPETWFDAAHPLAYLEAADLADADRALYESACTDAELGHPFLVEACILDAYWGDVDVAIAASLRVRDPELILPLDKPLLFARWEQQGPPSNGNWSVSADFATVTQSINGDPTLFVSPNSYVDVVIEGTIQVATTGDDDLVGFVFGMRSPIEAEGDPNTTFDTYLLDWKQGDQSSGGFFAAEGYALSYVNDDFASSGWLRFWGRDDVDGFESIATRYGSTEGWVDNAVNSFRLLHTANRVDIWMNGELIFRESGTFQDGRFGFYNYSQPSVRYADFRVVEVDAFTLCGDGVLDVGEECDDENTESGDGCAADCTSE